MRTHRLAVLASTLAFILAWLPGAGMAKDGASRDAAGVEKPPSTSCGPARKAQVTVEERGGGETRPASAFTPGEAWSEGAVTVGGVRITYCAVAGTLVVHPKGWDDTARDETTRAEGDTAAARPHGAEASVFYVAYIRRDGDRTTRPVTFLFNGGPGSATVWLHMGAFGPKRVEIPPVRHAAPAPYRLVDNDQSLLDVSDLVFIDAPGTGFSRIAGTDKEKAFYGVDEDAHAFAEFITAFLTKYQRWTAPKYLFGESYGTTRAALLVKRLQDDPGVDFNGVMMLSQVLAHDLYPDNPRSAPGNDLPYLLGLPTYAATAWYHAQPRDKPIPDLPLTLLNEAERFAMGEYAAALAAGSSLDAATREAVVAKLSAYTGLSPVYLRQSDLRVGMDEFRQELLRTQGRVVGAADTRFWGHALDRASRRALHDPVDAAIASPYVSAFNDYARRVLKYSDGRAYRPGVNEIGDQWNFRHQTPDGGSGEAPPDRAVNVLADLARAMKLNPLLKVQLNAGYFDLLTPWFQGKYEMRHLPIPPELRGNIEYRCYQSGHMVYLTAEGREQLHTNAAGFIERTSNPPVKRDKPRSPTPGCPSEQ